MRTLLVSVMGTQQGQDPVPEPTCQGDLRLGVSPGRNSQAAAWPKANHRIEL